MTFMHPQFLWLLPIVFILFYFILTQKEHQAIFFSDAVLERLRVSTNMLTLKARNALLLLMMIMIIVALGGPAIEEGKVNVQAKSADIMVALDISDSMLAEDVYPNRLALAKEKILDLLQKSPQERIGVMAFAKDAYLVSPLSFDHASVAFLMQQLNTDSITEKGTDFDQLLFSATNLLSKNSDKYLLIFTDGGDEEDFSKTISYAKEQGIKIFVVGMGNDQGVPIVDTKNGGFIKQEGNIILTRLNEKVAELATSTGGAYIEAITSHEDIDAMIKEMHAKTNRKILKEEEVIRYIPLFSYPLGLAMLLFLIATSSIGKRERLNMPHVFALFVMLSTLLPLQAALTDFKLLDEAAQQYSQGEYNRSATLYEDYASRMKEPAAYYNSANALYKQGDYKNAQKMYQKVFSDNDDLKFNSLHNLGNSYAKEGIPESLQHAVESYEKALKIKDDAQTKENLQRVKEALEKMKQEQQQDDKNRENKDQKDQNDKQKSKDQKDQQKSDKNSQDKKGDDSQNDDKKESKEQSDEQKQKEKEKASQENEEKKQQEQKSNKDEEKKKQQPAKAEATENDKIMSDLEEQKWLNELNQKRAGHMYQLQQLENKNEKNYEKPW